MTLIKQTFIDFIKWIYIFANYLLTKNEDRIPGCIDWGQYSKVKVWDFPTETKHSRLIPVVGNRPVGITGE